MKGNKPLAVPFVPRPKSPVDVQEGPESAGLRAAIDLIDHHDRFIHAFVSETDRFARLQPFTNSDLGSSVLRGALVGIKDIIRVDGLETRAGSFLPPEAFAGPQATLVDRLQEAGAIVAGKTVTAEFAVSASGPTRNPRDPSRTPGGSSSGSAAAVAAGLVPFAIGTQTVGSIIRPAAYCGVFGFRPSWGAIPTDGVIPNAPSLDTIGVFAADLGSLNLAAGILCQWNDNGWADGELPVLGVPTEDYLFSASPEGRYAFNCHLDRLRESGYEVREVPLTPEIQTLHRNLFTVQRFELAEVHSAWWREYSTLYQQSTAAAIRDGQRITGDEYKKANDWRTRFREQIAATMSDCEIDVWVTPSAPGLPPHGLSSTGNPVMSAPFSFAGLPAVSVPAPNPAGGIPFGFQCVGAVHQDQELLAHARGIAATLRSYDQSFSQTKTSAG